MTEEEALKLAAAKLPIKTRLLITGNDPWMLEGEANGA